MRIITGSLFAILALSSSANATITVPGANGSDGALAINTSTTIDLSQAPAGAWDSISPTAGKGVYDGDRWAVVFHYTSVNVTASGAISYKNNSARAPVVWLVSGDVNIAGTVDLTGGAWSTSNSTSNPQSEPGPGGFGGGRPTLASGAFTGANGPGWGPGGAQRGANSAGHNGPGPTGAAPGLAYGTAQIVPLVGGSGGGGTGNAGGAGGGAILIAATGTITVNGTIRSNGGIGANYGGTSFSASGSGGAIRLVGDTIAGSGNLSALGGTIGPAADGRIRIEGNTVSPSIVYAPLPSAAHPANPAVIWPDSTAPAVRIVSVGGFAVAAQPRGQLNAAADVLPDILPPSMTVVIETTNVATSSQVNLRVAPLSGDATTVAATYVSGNSTLATWNATVTLPPGSVSLQVRVEP